MSWDDPVTPPAQALEVTFALSDANAASATWALGDTAGVVAHGTLQRGQTTTVRVPVDAGESYRRVGVRFGVSAARVKPKPRLTPPRHISTLHNSRRFEGPLERFEALRNGRRGAAV